MKRANLAFLLALINALQHVDGLSAVTTKKTKVTPVASTSTRKISPINQEEKPRRIRRRTLEKQSPVLEADDFDWDESMASEFMELQKSTGSEILDARLQSQLDGIEHPNQFLDRHEVDATQLEKLAMSSVTQQLPKAALEALTIKEQSKRPRKTSKTDLEYSRVRVSPEEEVELATMIQKGAALEALKVEAEEKEGRPLTRQEWAKVAELSPKELRRQVAAYRQAKHLLVTANVGLVGAVVNQIWNKRKHAYNGITKEELIQEGSLGLLRAAELFDPSRGLRFSTYAVVWIKGVLSNSHIQELVRLPQREKLRWQKIQQAQKDLESQGEAGENALEKLSQVTDLSPQEILFTQRKMRQAQSLLSLDYEQQSQSRSGTETTALDLLQNDKALREEDMMQQAQLKADLIAAMAKNLEPREARLMRLRYGLSDGVPRTLTECAEAMGLSYTRVNQLSRQCLKKLREAAEAESLQEYLLTIA